MLNVIISDDNPELLQENELIVKNYIKEHPSKGVRVALATTDPQTLLNYIQQQPDEPTMYLLDIEYANSKQRGIDLAIKIRQKSLDAHIIFITTHEEFSPLIFEQKAAPLDFIAKEDGVNNLRDRLFTDLDRVLTIKSEHQINYLYYHLGQQERRVKISEVNYLVEHPRTQKITVYMSTGMIEFRGQLSEILQRYDNLYPLKKDILINLDNIDIERSKKELQFTDESVCPVSFWQLNQLKKHYRIQH